MSIILLVIAGILIGTFVISFGGGGAATYLGILSSSFHLTPEVAAATSIVTALPSLIIGSTIYIRQGKVNFHYGNRMLISALPAVVVGSLISPHIPKDLYKWLIAGILVILGIQILIKQFKKTAQNKQVSNHKSMAVIYGIISGLMVGVAGLSGGGPVLAGLLILGLNTFNATATSSYVLSGMSLVGAAFHLTDGHVYWQAGIPLIVGSIIGAFIAPMLVKHLSKSKNTSWAQWLIAFMLIFMGVKSAF